MSSIGYSPAACRAMVKSVEKNGNEMIGVGTVQQYQKSFIDVLCEGWITKHGKDYIDNTIVTNLNTDLKNMADALQRYADYMEIVAQKVSDDFDNTVPYWKVNPKIVVGQFNSEKSLAFKTKNGKEVHFLDDDALEEGIKQISSFIENRLKKNHDEIEDDWNRYSDAFSKDGDSLVEEWIGAFNSAYNSALKDLESFKTELSRVLKSKIKETEEARNNMNLVNSFK